MNTELCVLSSAKMEVESEKLFFLVLQFTPDPENPIDLTEYVGEEPSDVVTLVFYPVNPTQPITVGGVEVEFCAKESKHCYYLAVLTKFQTFSSKIPKDTVFHFC